MDISLALGGGGAKGNAHIGILRVLEREGFQIKALAGTSIGGIIGALYAAGYSADEIAQLVIQVNQRHLFSRGGKEYPAFLGSGGIRKFLEQHLGDRTFADLKIPFAVVAVELDHGREVVLNKGDLVASLLATSAIPGVLPAQKTEEGGLLVDGGISNPIPVNVARKMAPELPLIAVPLNASWEEPHVLETPTLFPPVPGTELISRLRLSKALDVMVRSLDVSQRLLTQLRLEMDPPEFIIAPDVESVPILGEVDVAEVIAIGEQAAEQALPMLYQVLR